MKLRKSQNQKQEVFFGECEYSQKLDKTGEYLHSLNSVANGHMINNVEKRRFFLFFWGSNLLPGQDLDAISIPFQIYLIQTTTTTSGFYPFSNNSPKVLICLNNIIFLSF
jgi:hypothetical protein